MIYEYKIYRKSDLTPVVSHIELPACQMIGRKKYVGTKARIEAIYRLTGKRLPDEYTTLQVKKYLAAELFNTSLWHKYRKVYDEVSNEVEFVTEYFSYQYALIVELKDEPNLSPTDERVIYFVKCELLGTPCKIVYKGMKNPVISLYKNYDR